MHDTPLVVPNCPPTISGLSIIIDDSMVKQKRRHKRKRINKKYRKQFGLVPLSHAISCNGSLIMHPAFYAKVRRS